MICVELDELVDDRGGLCAILHPCAVDHMTHSGRILFSHFIITVCKPGRSALPLALDCLR